MTQELGEVRTALAGPHDPVVRRLQDRLFEDLRERSVGEDLTFVPRAATGDPARWTDPPGRGTVALTKEPAAGATLVHVQRFSRAYVPFVEDGMAVKGHRVEAKIWIRTRRTSSA